MKCCIHKIREQSLAQCEKGVALIEFALVLPFLLLLVFGIVEISRALLVIQQVDKTIIVTNNIVTQYLSPDSPPNNGQIPISTAVLENLMSWVPSMMPVSPPFETNGIIIISDVSTGSNPNDPIINWQYCGGGALKQKSRIGTVSAPVTLPAGFNMNANEEVVIGEIYYQYAPLISGIIPVSIPPFYRTSIFVPRFQSLSSFVSANCS